MSNHAFSFRLDELSFAPDTVQVSQEEKMIYQEPCDQWKVWASNSSSRKRKQQNFAECFQIRDNTFGKDDDQDLIENDDIDFRVESHMRLQYHSTIVEDISSVNHQQHDNIMVQLPKKQRWADWCGGSAASRRRAAPRIIIRNSHAGQASS